MDERWTFEWPTEPGHYWFYGRETPYALKDEMQLVEARWSANGYLVVGSITILDQERACGMWQPAELPEPPDHLLQGEDREHS